MTDQKNPKLERIPFNTDVIKEDRYEQHWDLFLQYKETKEQSVRFFNKNGISRNILDYVKDSVDRMNEHHLKPSYKEDWQNNVFDPKTRDKLIAVLSQLSASRMKPMIELESVNLFSVAKLDFRKSVYSDLLEAANRKNKDQQQLIWEMYTAMSEGTVFGFESWKKDAREVEYVTEFNPDTGEKKTEKVNFNDWDDVFGEIIPIQEVFPETIWTSKWSDIKRCFWAREMTFEGFQDALGGFPGADKVHDKAHYEQDSTLPWGISSDVHPRNVFVLYFFDAAKDKMGIWANGTELYYGPLPWNHKKLPIWMAIFEPIHHKFLFGKSLPDKLMGMQDINNAILNGMLDQLFLSLNSPYFIDGEFVDDLDQGYLEPGRYYEISPGSKVQRANLGQVDSAAGQMLNLIQRSMEESSVSAQSQGVPTGGRKTKFEVQQLQQGALNLASLFLSMMEESMAQKYWLRLHNILQYYAMPAQSKSGNPKFKFITLDNRELTNGKIGKRMIQVVNSQEEVLPKEELGALAERETGEPFDVLEARVEPITLSRDYFLNREFELSMSIVPNSSIKETQSDKDNKAIAFYQMTAENPQIDQEKNLKDFAVAMGKDPDIVKPQQEQQQDPIAAVMAGAQGGAGRKGIAAGGNNQPDLDLL